MRTFSPKYANYFGDGSGRDSYVVTNNGGLANIDKVGMLSRPYRNTLRNRNHSPQKEPLPVYYHSDGSGRDSYVVNNAGGLATDYGSSHRPDVNFLQSLRQSPKLVMPQQYDPSDMTGYMGWVDNRNKKILLSNARVAYDVTKRLSSNPSILTSPIKVKLYLQLTIDLEVNQSCSN
jgi:hypothetical protein